MENEKVLKFKALVEKDPELKEKLRAAASVDEVIALAAESGVALDRSDFPEMPRQGELSAEELDKVAGGSIESDVCFYVGFLAYW